MTVYIDLYILTNLILNYIILRITKFIIKSQTSNVRLLVSSILGTLVSVLILLPQFNFLTYGTCKILLCAIMVLTAYGKLGTNTFLKTTVVFFFVSFLIGGCGFALFESGLNETVYILILSTGLSYLILNTVISIFEKYFKFDRLTHTLTIKMFEKEITTDCFYDTGNNLKDPVTKAPVIIVSYEILREILPQKLATDLENQQDILKIYSTNNLKIKLKLIPFHTISDNGFILGFVPDMVLIDGKSTNAIVGISPKKFGKKYKAIANPQINWNGGYRLYE